MRGKNFFVYSREEEFVSFRLRFLSIL